MQPQSACLMNPIAKISVLSRVPLRKIGGTYYLLENTKIRNYVSTGEKRLIASVRNVILIIQIILSGGGRFEKTCG